MKVPNFVNGVNTRGNMGLFKWMGYSAKKDGPNKEQRQAILRRIWVTEFEPTGDNSQYIESFGLPSSRIRFIKMMHYLDGRWRDVENREGPNWAEVSNKYGSDHDWLIDTYGRSWDSSEGAWFE